MSGKIKEEQGDQNKKAVQPARNKFVPKLPVKKEKSDATQATSQAPSVQHGEGSSSNQQKPPRNSESDRRNDRKKIGERGGRGGGRTTGGRGRWVMPTGVDFFGAGAVGTQKPTVSSSVVNTESKSVTTTGSIRAPTIKPKTNRIARPNEYIDDFGKDKATFVERVYVPDSYQKPNEDDPYDSDDLEAEERKEEILAEQPKNPNEFVYNPYSPVKLPLGPSAITRRNLADQPILAAPDDQLGLEIEKNNSVFLLQLPSDLRFDKILNGHHTVAGMEEKHAIDLSNELNQSSGEIKENKHKQIKLGKIQLLRSGRVRMITETGKSFDVNSGIAASFLQSLAAIEVSTDSEGNNDKNKSIIDDALKIEGKKTAPRKVRKTEQEKEGLYFLGNITRKLVVTPDYEIGVKNTYLNAASTKVKEEEEEVEMVVDPSFS